MPADMVHTDCAGEVAGAYCFDWLLHRDPQSLEHFRNLTVFVFDKMRTREERLKGMTRWSTTAWGVCYQDDVAQVILGQLLYIKQTGDCTRLLTWSS